MQHLARLAFWGALAFSFVMAVLSRAPRIPGEPSDKILHALAFFTLGALGAIAFPALTLMRLVLMLTAFGGLIEAVQAIPALNRDSSIADLAVDSIAALIAALATRFIVVKFRA